MTGNNEKGSVEPRINDLANWKDRVDKTLFGNGREGIQERVARIEENLTGIKEDVQGVKEDVNELKEMISSLSKDFSEFKGDVKTHICNSDLHTVRGLLLKKDILVYFFLAVMIINLIIPADLTLYELVKKLLGL